MVLHEDKQCPRCKQLFECKCGSITLCHCSKTQLDSETLEALRLQYNDCLCAHCLLEIQSAMIEIKA